MSQVIVKLIGNYSYYTTHCLGEGVYGKVFQGIDRQTKEKVAIKKIDMNIFANDKYLQNAIFSEIHMLKRFNHSNIVRFKDVLSTSSSLYIITQYCKNGDLKQLIIKKKKFKQEQAFQVIRQILCGFTQLVQQKIVHRDLKPANILINQDVYKIADFGFAKYVDNFGTQMLKSCVGSPIYMAPQILQRCSYTTKCDIWSIGIIFFEMMIGVPPYKARDQNQLLRNLRNFSLQKILYQQYFSQKSKQFLRKCLAYRQQERASWNELFQLYLYNNKIQKTLLPQQPQINQFHFIDYRNRNYSNPSTSLQNNNSYVSTNANSNVSIINASQYLKKQQQATINRYTPTANYLQQQPKYVFNNNTISHNSLNSDNLAMVRNSRDDSIYKSFVCNELVQNLSYIRNFLIQQSLRIEKIVYVLINSIRIRTTYNFSLFNLYFKGNKSHEELNRKIQKQIEYNSELQNDVIIQIQSSQSSLRKIKQDVGYIVGNKTDIINEDKINKVQNFLLKLVQQYAKLLLIQIRKRNRYPQQMLIIQVLQWLYDLILLITKKQKAKGDLSINQRYQQSNFIQHSFKLMSKLDMAIQNIV